MLLEHKFITLTYEKSGAPCILRVDRIKTILKLANGKTRITCDSGRIVRVNEAEEDILKMIYGDKEKKG